MTDLREISQIRINIRQASAAITSDFQRKMNGILYTLVVRPEYHLLKAEVAVAYISVKPSWWQDCWYAGRRKIIKTVLVASWCQ